MLILIKLYRLLLRPFVGNCCRFYPSCSEYAEEAIKSYGQIKGGYLTVKRLFKCGPWHPGGYDPICPDKESLASDQAVEQSSSDCSSP